jgi:hypothetical protein
MPLLDHFHPPLSQRRHWDSFHGAWAEAIATHLNASLLPPRYFAEARVTVGPRAEIDVGTFVEDHGEELSAWQPPSPTATSPLSFNRPDLFEVQVLNDEQGPRVVAAIELVSPANKDRHGHRQMFAVKCASYLQQGIGLVVVDVVTERHANLHAVLLDLLGITNSVPVREEGQLYGVAYRTVSSGDADDWSLELWAEQLELATRMPVLPLWIGPELCVPLDLEQTYAAACQARRIS